MGAQSFHKSRIHFQILGARWVTWSKLHTDDPQISGVSMQNVVFKFHILKTNKMQ